MENILMIFLGAAVVIWFSLINQIEQSSELKEQKIANHTSRVTFVKGLPGFQEGAIVTINLYNDKITVNDNQVIPLDNIKEATTFKVRQMMLENERVIKKLVLDLLLPKKLGIIIRCIMNTKTLTFLSIEFINQQEQECNCLFFSDNHKNMIRFVENINQKRLLFC